MNPEDQLHREPLHQEPLHPFSFKDTLFSLPRWAVSIPHLAGWLGIFILADKTVMDCRRMDRLGKLFCRCVTTLAGVRVRQHGLNRLDPHQSYVFCINHVSLLDLFVVFQSIPFFHRSFQDISHFKIPIYGGCIRVAGQLPVSRKDKALNRRSFDRAIEMLHSGDSFVVFPEGHRTRDGRLGQFYPGAFRLAIEAQAPVVPMGLSGLRNICPAGQWRLRPGTVNVLFGDPLPTSGLTVDQAPELAQQARQALNDLLAAGPGGS